MRETFIKLVAALAVCDSPEPAIDDRARWTTLLKAIYRLNDPQAHSFLAAINISGLPNESPSALLLRSHLHAKQALPALLMAMREAQQKAEEKTNRSRYIQEQAQSDPFLENANLTTDAFARRGAVEPEQPAKLDGWGNVRE